MRSLFAKILLWFVATAVITIAAVVLTSIPNFDRQPPWGMAMRIQMREVRYAYETGGKAALAEALKKVHPILQADMIMADSTGKDLLTGEDHSSLIRTFAGRR